MIIINNLACFSSSLLDQNRASWPPFEKEIPFFALGHSSHTCSRFEEEGSRLEVTRVSLINGQMSADMKWDFH